MSLLLFVALAGYLLASKINQSVVICEILLGLLIGPSVLGLITYTDFVASMAHLGAVILLFVVGLEFKLKDVFEVKYFIIALVGVLVPWVGGFWLASVFGYSFQGAIFTGTALTATSIAITAQVLKEMGVLQSPMAKAIIGAAVIDDILGLLALSFSQQIVQGTLALFPILMVLGKALVFLVVGAFVGYTFMSRLIEHVDRSSLAKRFPEFVFLFAMAIAFLYAMIAEWLQLSAIVGSFLAGVALEGAVVRHGKDYRVGTEYFHIIFASIFFVSLGILADAHALTWSVALFMMLLTLVAIITKVMGCSIPAKLLGMDAADALHVGIGMVPRGEVAMIVALLGLNAGLIQQDLYLSLVLMSLLTTIIAPMVLKPLLLRKETARANG